MKKKKKIEEPWNQRDQNKVSAVHVIPQRGISKSENV